MNDCGRKIEEAKDSKKLQTSPRSKQRRNRARELVVSGSIILNVMDIATFIVQT